MSREEERTNPSGIESPSLSAVGRTPARYLFAISKLSGDDRERVSTGDLHASLDVTPASVTGMISKLDDRGWVDYEPYRGVRLTEPAAGVAARVSWRVCTVTGFFESVLDTTLDESTAFEMGWTLPAAGPLRLPEFATSPCLDLCPESVGEPDRCPA